MGVHWTASPPANWRYLQLYNNISDDTVIMIKTKHNKKPKKMRIKITGVRL